MAKTLIEWTDATWNPGADGTSRVVLEKAEYRDSTKPGAKPGDKELSKPEVLQSGGSAS